MELAGPIKKGMTNVTKELVDSVASEPITDLHQAEELVSQDVGSWLGYYVRPAPRLSSSLERIVCVVYPIILRSLT